MRNDRSGCLQTLQEECSVGEIKACGAEQRQMEKSFVNMLVYFCKEKDQNKCQMFNLHVAFLGSFCGAI